MQVVERLIRVTVAKPVNMKTFNEMGRADESYGLG